VALFSFFNNRKSNNPLTWEKQITAENLTEEQFTVLYRDALQKKLPDAEIKITGSLELNVKLEDKNFICWLGNAWNECENQPDARIDICEYRIDLFLRTVNDDRDIKENIDPNRIVPEIKCKEYLDNIPLQADGSHPIYSKLIAGDIYLTYALRLDREICFLSTTDLEETNLLNEKLYDLALTNLKDLATEVRVHGRSPLFIITSDGVSASSMLLVDKIWEQQRSNISGDIIACVPSKDFLLFTDSERPEGITELQNKSGEISEIDPYLISQTLLIRKDGKWVVYQK
jgi:uncharacterized protein YtpQ (UPF0354 family)